MYSVLIRFTNICLSFRNGDDMAKRIERDFATANGIFNRPEPLNNFARQKMKEMTALLKDHTGYNCAPSCTNCCYGSILMSYTEFTAITLFLQEHWTTEQMEQLMSNRVGLLKEDGMLLCPFLNTDAELEHCRIYPTRPLICRVFGTTAAPCDEDISPSPFSEELFNLTHTLLYYSGSQFIALNLNAAWALFEAPFALWCLADNNEADRRFLCKLLEQQGDSFRAVLYDRQEHSFFTLQRGEKNCLNTF